MATADEIIAAPIGSVFVGARPVQRRLPPHGFGIFGLFDNNRGMLEVQRCDDEAPDDYDDVDAAADALAVGYSLVKVPHGESWRMLVIDEIVGRKCRPLDHDEIAAVLRGDETHPIVQNIREELAPTEAS